MSKKIIGWLIAIFGILVLLSLFFSLWEPVIFYIVIYMTFGFLGYIALTIILIIWNYLIITPLKYLKPDINKLFVEDMPYEQSSTYMKYFYILKPVLFLEFRPDFLHYPFPLFPF